MIRCPKCEAENQIGAIFCRGCGEKLELDELKPDAVKSAARDARGSQVNVFSWVKNIIMLGILIVLVLGFLGLFATPGSWNEPLHTKADLKSGKSKLNAFYRGQKVTLKEGEVNALMEDWFGLTEDQLETFLKEKEEAGDVGMIPRKLQVTLLGDGRVRLIMFQQHNGKEFIKYYSVIEGELEAGEAGLTINPDNYAQGKIPFNMLAFLKEKVDTRFSEQYPSIQPFTEFIKAVKKVEVNEGELVLLGRARAGIAPVKQTGGGGSGRRRRR
ncbi:hypothetical protein BVX99_01900 [bacterium F16]|nr:hypothetical protein BVX99_01900 [bacterium F16]